MKIRIVLGLPTGMDTDSSNRLTYSFDYCKALCPYPIEVKAIPAIIHASTSNSAHAFFHIDKPMTIWAFLFGFVLQLC